MVRLVAIIQVLRAVPLPQQPIRDKHRCLLERMRQRALNLEAFLNATHHTMFLGDNKPQISLSGGKDYEVSVCPAVKVAFIHIYKSAGTTGKRLIEEGCPERRHQYSCCGCNRETRMPVCHLKKDGDDWHWFDNVTVTYAFVRDPLERFQSGIFELARRQQPWMLTLLKEASASKRTVADVVIDALLEQRMQHPYLLPDPHIMPQTFFLNDGGKAVPHLKYIAFLGPQFDEEAQVLATRLYGHHHQIARLPKYNAAKNASDGRHHLYIRDEDLSQATRLKIFDYYRTDYGWLGGMH